MQEYTCGKGNIRVVVNEIENTDICDICEKPAIINMEIWFRNFLLSNLYVCKECFETLLGDLSCK